MYFSLIRYKNDTNANPLEVSIACTPLQGKILGINYVADRSAASVSKRSRLARVLLVSISI